jgi:hypothetical protein
MALRVFACLQNKSRRAFFLFFSLHSPCIETFFKIYRKVVFFVAPLPKDRSGAVVMIERLNLYPVYVIRIKARNEKRPDYIK